MPSNEPKNLQNGKELTLEDAEFLSIFDSVCTEVFFRNNKQFEPDGCDFCVLKFWDMS